MLLRRTGWLIAGMVGMLILAELILALLPLPDGLGAADPVPDWPARRMVPGARFTWSNGWDMTDVVRGRVNNAGYAAPFDYRPGAPAGIVIGDSFVQGYTDPYDTLLQARLADDLSMPRDAVYNFGTAGAALPHYLGVARLAGARYRPRWAAVVIAEADFVEGFGSTPGYWRWSDGGGDPITLVPETVRRGLKGRIRDSAIVRYVRFNLAFDLRHLFASGFEAAPHPVCRREVLSADDRRLAAAWVAALPVALHLPPARIVLVFDADRLAIVADRPMPPACPDRDGLARRLLAGMAAGAGMRVLDTAPILAAGWRRDHVPLDRWPVDSHWTPYTHRLVADAVAAELGATGPVRQARGRIE